jgi:Transglycosylase SLT domain
MRRAVLLAIVLCVITWAPAALAECSDSAAPAADTGRTKDDAVLPGTAKPEIDHSPKTVCALIEAAAGANQLPVGYFTRLIWKESRFHATAVSPKGAEGIAQFMPGTASLRQLSDPFDPQEAIPAAASYLHDLIARFGNLGLAAAAYNAGVQRVADWIAGVGGLPWETQDYVLSITGRSAEEWAKPEADPPGAGKPTKPAPTESCLIVAAALSRPGAGSLVVAGGAKTLNKGPWAPWGVQVAGNFSLDRAMASFASVQRRYPDIVTGQPMVVRSVDRSRGPAPLFQIRLPAPDQKQAAGICHRLEAAGGACVVFRN